MAQPISKYKRVPKPGEVVAGHGYPLTLEIISDGNVLRYKEHQTDKVTYTYIRSASKINLELTMTNEQLARMLGWTTDGQAFMNNGNRVAKIVL